MFLSLCFRPTWQTSWPSLPSSPATACSQVISTSLRGESCSPSASNLWPPRPPPYPSPSQILSRSLTRTLSLSLSCQLISEPWDSDWLLKGWQRSKCERGKQALINLLSSPPPSLNKEGGKTREEEKVEKKGEEREIHVALRGRGHRGACLLKPEEHC